MKLPWSDGIPREEKLSWKERRQVRKDTERREAAEHLFNTFSEEQKLKLLNQITESRALLPLLPNNEHESADIMCGRILDLTVNAILDVNAAGRNAMAGLDTSQKFALVSHQLSEMEKKIIEASKSTETGIVAEGGLTAGKYTDKLLPRGPRSL